MPKILTTYMLHLSLLILCTVVQVSPSEPETVTHLISLEFSEVGLDSPVDIGPGAQLQADASNRGDAVLPAEKVSMVREQMFFTALVFGFSVLHLILFVILPGQRSNLYYALFLVFLSLGIYFDFQQWLVDTPAANINVLRFHRLSMGLCIAFGVRFFYELFASPLSLHTRLLIAGLFVTGVIATIDPVQLFVLVEVLMVVAMADMVRVLVQAIRSHRESAWIVASGFLVFALSAVYDLLLDAGLIPSIAGITNAYHYGVTGLLIATSAYLAKDIARTNTKVLEQESQAQKQEADRQLLSAEIARKTKELEEARALQLSMLPRSLPTLPDFEIAVHMETATEVGGDYYDFHVDADGTLMAVIGDATGHGTKAGIMVAIAKSLFKSIVPSRDLPAFFNRCTDILKPMNLATNFMALTLVRIRDHSIVASAAGMPPILIYRKRTGRVEEITLKGMPLGAFRDFPYQQTSTELERGDTVLLFTDGLCELFNPSKEMLGVDRIGNVLKEIGSATPEAIVNHLRETMDRWREGRPQDDDVTFVVIQKR